MKKPGFRQLLLLLPAVLIVALCWWLTRRAATPDGHLAIEGALRQARPADVQSITVYPLLPDPRTGEARPFQLRTAAEVHTLLPALKLLRPLPVPAEFSPLLGATLMVRLTPGLATAWHLHSRDIIFRLVTTSVGEVALRAHSRVMYQCPALSQRVQQVRDSLASHQE